MGEHILVPFDGLPVAWIVIEHATSRFPEAPLTLLFVVNLMADYSRHRAYSG